MSFVLQIWELPQGREWPKTIKEATTLVSELHGGGKGQNPKFIELARRLTARFPCITTPEADALDEGEAAWTEGPLDGITDEAIYGLGVNIDRLDDVRPFVIETALALGLSVEDEQAGEYFLANGQVLSIEAEWAAKRRAEAAAARAALAQTGLPALADLVARVCDDLADVLARSGFARTAERDSSGPGYVSTAYLRQGVSSWHQLSVSVGSDGPTQGDISVEWTPGHAPSSALRNHIRDLGTPGEAKDYTLGRIPQHKWIDNAAGLLVPNRRGDVFKYMLQRRDDIAPRTQHLAQQIESRLVPLLAAFDDLQAFDRLVNPDPVTGSMFFADYAGGAHHIVAAYLAGSPRLAALCTEFWDNTQRETRFMEGARMHLHACIAYVRANPRH